MFERKLLAKLPNVGLKAKPHIESRLKTLKNDFDIVHDMLTGSNTIGFGWDNARKFVILEDPIREAFLQVKEFCVN